MKHKNEIGFNDLLPYIKQESIDHLLAEVQESFTFATSGLCKTTEHTVAGEIVWNFKFNKITFNMLESIKHRKALEDYELEEISRVELFIVEKNLARIVKNNSDCQVDHSLEGILIGDFAIIPDRIDNRKCLIIQKIEDSNMRGDNEVLHDQYLKCIDNLFVIKDKEVEYKE